MTQRESIVKMSRDELIHILQDYLEETNNILKEKEAVSAIDIDDDQVTLYLEQLPNLPF